MSEEITPLESANSPAGAFPARDGNMVGTIVLFELGLLPVAWILGWLLGHWNWKQLLTLPAPAEWLPLIGLGLTSLGPMLLLLLCLMQSRWPSAIRLRSVVDQFVGSALRGASFPALVAVSLAAGVGEEWLFRGLIQGGLNHWWGDGGQLSALIVAALVFGVCHWATHLYLVSAMLMGLYLGGLYLWSESLLVPIVAHSAYDLVGLTILVRQRASREPLEKADGSPTVACEPSEIGQIHSR